ncbi:MAG: GGDEF domain-containing protein [Proteobacteria bacterium]|jgi:diguanylate cyclase (GGDEF)-like protein|nr:GGDEF domain-containing protein [Pseudomonadota bacterium]
MSDSNRESEHRFDLRHRFEELRQLLSQNDREHIDQHLTTLEDRLAEFMGQAEAEAEAVADANVCAVEIIERQEALNIELQTQNRLLEDQNLRIEAARAEIAAQALALADANVEAVFWVEKSEEEIAKLAQTREILSTLNRELTRRAQVLESVTKDLEQRAYRDAVTGLLNHRYFRDQVAKEFARARRYERSLSIIFLDLDHFKCLNDNHGHQVGDKVLEMVGGMLTRELRWADVTVQLGARPFAARYGGEEFVLILPETDLEGGVAVAERVRKRLRDTRFPGGDTQPLGCVTVSGGVAAISPLDSTPADLIKRADANLYRAKGGGRDRIEAG